MGGSLFTGENIFGYDLIIHFDYVITYAGCPAKTYGPPEDCYPAEPMEYEITLTGVAFDTPEEKNKYLELPKWLHDIILEWLYDSDRVHEQIKEDGENSCDDREYDEDYYRDER